MTGQGQTVSCIPLWVLKDIKNYIKKSSYYRRSQSTTGHNRDLVKCSPAPVRRRMRSEERVSGRPLRIAVIGGDKVGKSALTVRFLTKRFIGEYRSDSDMLYRSVLRVGGSQHAVELLDCSGEHPKDEAIEWAEAFIVVYSITDSSSVASAKSALQAVQAVRSDLPLLVCGNKGDLDHQRQVSRTDGEGMATTLRGKFAEVSAAEDYDSVSECFDDLLREVKGNRGTTSPRFRRMSPKLLRTLLSRQNCNSSDRPTELIILDDRDYLNVLTNSTPV